MIIFTAAVNGLPHPTVRLHLSDTLYNRTIELQPDSKHSQWTQELDNNRTLRAVYTYHSGSEDSNVSLSLSPFGSVLPDSPDTAGEYKIELRQTVFTGPENQVTFNVLPGKPSSINFVLNKCTHRKSVIDRLNCPITTTLYYRSTMHDLHVYVEPDTAHTVKYSPT